MSLRYINLELGFHRHPKTRRLVGLLGRGAETILTRLWCHCGEHHCETGTLTGYSEHEIESIVEWWGKPGACVEALVKLGFLSSIENGFIVHDFLVHSGHLAYLKRRGRENAEKRWSKKPRDDASSNASSIPSSNAPPPLPPSKPSPSEKAPGKIGPPEDLAQRFRFVQRGRKEILEELTDTIGEMIRVGYPVDAIRAEVERATRDRSERFFRLKDRLEKSHFSQRGQHAGHLGAGRVRVTEQALETSRERRAAQDARGSQDPSAATPPEP